MRKYSEKLFPNVYDSSRTDIMMEYERKNGEKTQIKVREYEEKDRKNWDKMIGVLRTRGTADETKIGYVFGVLEAMMNDCFVMLECFRLLFSRKADVEMLMQAVKLTSVERLLTSRFLMMPFDKLGGDEWHAKVKCGRMHLWKVLIERLLESNDSGEVESILKMVRVLLRDRKELTETEEMIGEVIKVENLDLLMNRICKEV